MSLEPCKKCRKHLIIGYRCRTCGGLFCWRCMHSIAGLECIDCGKARQVAEKGNVKKEVRSEDY